MTDNNGPPPEGVEPPEREGEWTTVTSTSQKQADAERKKKEQELIEKQENGEIQKKKDAHGAKLAAPMTEKTRLFFLQFTIKENADGTINEPVNLSKIHKEFIVEFLKESAGDVQFSPTVNYSNDPDKCPAPMISADAFPTMDRTHRQFFKRDEDRKEHNKTTILRLVHSVTMKETVAQVKKKLLPFLQKHKLKMGGGELSTVENAGFGWFAQAHPRMVWHPKLAKTVTNLIHQLPDLEQILEEFIPENDPKVLPELKIFRDTIRMGKSSSESVVLFCVQNRVRLMKELVARIPPEQLPFIFIPFSFVQMCGHEQYQKYLIKNNDFQNSVQGIPVSGFTREIFECMLEDTDSGNSISVFQYFLERPSIVSIELTGGTNQHGRFLFIVKKSQYQEAREAITHFCQDYFKMCYPDPVSRAEYRKCFNCYPHIVDSAPVGGAVLLSCHRANNLLLREEASLGSTLNTVPNAWKQTAAPKLVFDKDVDFPLMPPAHTLNNAAAAGTANPATNPLTLPQPASTYNL